VTRKKLILVLLAVVVAFIITGCVQITGLPNLSGAWTLTMNPYAQDIEFDMTVIQEEGSLSFEAVADDPTVVVSGGAVTYSPINRVGMTVTVNGHLYSLFGEVKTDLLTGFLRDGVYGDVVGYWSATKGVVE